MKGRYKLICSALAVSFVIAGALSYKPAFANGSIASYASCMVFNSITFFRYNYSGDEARGYCWNL